MRLIYVTSQFPWGYGESFFLSEVRELIRRGTEIAIIPVRPRKSVPEDRADLKALSIRVPLLGANVMGSAVRTAFSGQSAVRQWIHLNRQGTISARLKNSLVYAKALWLADLATRQKADHIHALWASTSATIAMVASELTGIPWSFSAHRGDLETPNLLVQKIQRSSFIRFIAEDGRQTATKIAGNGYESKMYVRHLGIDVPEHNCYNADIPAQVGLCVAALIERKGHIYLLRALRRLRYAGVNVQIWLAGRGDQERFLREQGKDLVEMGALRFLGHLSNEDVLKMYRQNRIGFAVLSSLHEGIPVALMEAMAHGVPVVATDAGGTGELLGGGAGVIVPTACERSLANAIAGVAESTAERQRLSLQGYQRVKKDFNVVNTAGELAALCGSFAAGSTKRVAAA